jgi:hypothetical protein
VEHVIGDFGKARKGEAKESNVKVKSEIFMALGRAVVAF